MLRRDRFWLQLFHDGGWLDHCSYTTEAEARVDFRAMANHPFRWRLVERTAVDRELPQGDAEAKFVTFRRQL